MGTTRVRYIEEPAEQQQTFDRVKADIRCLVGMIEAGELERGTPRIGAEQELYLVDRAYLPAPVVVEFLEGIDDPRFTTELARFNLEINLDPLELGGDCFRRMERELGDALRTARSRCNELGGIGILLAGILPTVRPMDLQLENLTPNERSRAMIAAMEQLKRKDYSIRIDGIDSLAVADTSNMFESANTAFQVHYQFNPGEFAEVYNYAQAVAGPVLAACTNSPILFGRRLWHETRIALFQQAVDVRRDAVHLSQGHVRVPFGDSWVDGPVTELFRDDLATFTLFLASTSDEDSLARWEGGELPGLVHLEAFNSSIFRWNRACFGTTDGKPHLRLENRLLPSGPSVRDEVANAAFWVGLMHGMPDRHRRIHERMEFADAKGNLLKAARHGLEAQFRWLGGDAVDPRELILDELLPIARDGLRRASVDEEDIESCLAIVGARVEGGRTGSRWMLEAWKELGGIGKKDSRAAALAAAIHRRQQGDSVVHEWALPTEDEFEHPHASRVSQLMTTQTLCVERADLLEQTLLRMLDKDHDHVPVTDSAGRIEGLLEKSAVLERMVGAGGAEGSPALTVGDVMDPDPLTVAPSTALDRALERMREAGARCLLVEHDDRLVGIITERDITDVAAFLLATLEEDEDG